MNSPFPPPDPERGGRICQDVIDLMKIRDDEHNQHLVGRWLELTLEKAKRFNRRPWWFARRLFGCRIFSGQDMFDLTGDMDRMIAVFCLVKLKQIALGEILERRNRAYYHSRVNCGDPRYYNFDGARLHLWPAPDRDMLLVISYTCPLEAEIVPVEWETILLDGIIGLYGRFFDSTGLINKESGAEFQPRFWEGLKASRSEHFDSEVHERQLDAWPKQPGDTLYTMWAESQSGSVGQLSVTPSYRGEPGEIQIPADEGLEHLNQPGVPITQIPGNYNPSDSPSASRNPLSDQKTTDSEKRKAKSERRKIA